MPAGITSRAHVRLARVVDAAVMELTLAEWWGLAPEHRTVVVDQLLERMPPGYVDPRAVGHAAGPLPQFIHQETNVLFHVVFGGPAVLGMSERRFARLSHVTVRDDDEYSMVPVARVEDAQPLRPAREVVVPTALVAEQPLTFGILRKLGLDETRLSIAGVSPIAIGAVLKALTAHRWRLPSEAEWEFACRAVHDTVDDDDPPLSPTGRLGSTGLAQMGHRRELCRDSWHADLTDYPAQGPRGQGHEVLRGHGLGASFVGYGEDAAWTEALWPGRRPLAGMRDAVSIRPWVDLLK